MITSRANEKVKYARSLQRADVRRKEQSFVIEGIRLVEEALVAGLAPKLVLVAPDQLGASARGRRLLERIEQYDWAAASDSVIKAAADTQSPQGVVAVFPLPERAYPHDLGVLVLVLDGLRDPGNVGTILRTAEAAGVRVVMLTEECVDPYNPKVLRGAMGAHFRLHVLDDQTWRQIEQLLRGRAIWLATSRDGTPYFEADWTRGSALIIGNEAFGASAGARRLATGQVTIPMAGKAESLNAAVAAGIILFEALRQRTA